MNMQKWLKAGIAGLVALLAVQGNGAPPAGAYHGVAYRHIMFGDESLGVVCGTFSLNTTERERITAKVVLRERTLSFKAEGWEDAESGPYVRMESRGGEILELRFLADLGMIGTLSGGSLGDEEMVVAATHHAFADRADAAAQAKLARVQGYYTIALASWNVLPRGDAKEAQQGSGYLTMTVGAGGKVKIAGVLADGTKVSQASVLTTIGVPFFRPLYRRRGEIGALLNINPDTRVVEPGLVRDVYWDKPGSGPDGFQAQFIAVGGYFSKGAPLPQPTYWLRAVSNDILFHLPGGGSVLPQPAWPLFESVTATGTRLEVQKGVEPVLSDDATHYIYTSTNSSLATLRYSPLTGIFKGSFNQYYDYDSGGKLIHKVVKTPFAGVMLQTRPEWLKSVGLGHYLVPETNPAFRSLRIKHSFWIELVDYYAPL